VSDEEGIVAVPFAGDETVKKITLPGETPRVPILDGERIMVTRTGEETAAPAVYSLSPGADVRWRSQLSGEIIQAATLYRGAIYTGTDREFVALNAATGESKWRVSRGMDTEDWDAQLTENLAPTVTERSAIFSTVDGLIALDPAGGERLWEVDGNRISSPPVVRDDRVYAPDFGRGIRSFDAVTGDQLWEFECDGSWATPSVGKQVVFAGYEGGIVALDRSDGRPIDRISTHRYAAPPSGISKIGETVVTGTTDDSVVTVDWDGRKFVPSDHEPRGGGSYTAPTFTGNRLIFVEYVGGDVRLAVRDGSG
jgi:outer membrane protein assembly factor BamB